MNEAFSFWRNLTFSLTSLLFLMSASAHSQTSEKVIYLNHADSLLGMDIGNEKAQRLIGHVKFTQGKIIVTCNTATRYLQSNKIVLEDNVIIRQDSVTMVANRGTYYGNEKVAEAFNSVRLDDGTMTLHADFGKYFMDEKKAFFRSNVIVEDSTSTLTSDEFTYWREEQKSLADGNVKITNNQNRMTLLGGHFENFRKLGYNKMTNQPVAIQADTAVDGSIDSMIVMSNVMESFQDSVPRLIATDSVIITRSDGAAAGGYAVFYTKLDSVVLKRNPVVWYTHSEWETTQVSGDSMFIKLNKRRLERLHVQGSAVAISRADSLRPYRYHQMTGQDITMYFRESAVQKIEVDKTATVLYYVFDGKKPNGFNKTSGDRVSITFNDGKINKIKVIGGVEGQYYPEKMTKNREIEYNLPAFNWKTPAKK